MRGPTWLLIAAFICATCAGAANGATSSPTPQLRLHRTTLNLAASSRLASAALAPAPGPYAIVQFRGPITTVDRAALRRTGVTILEYLPDFAYLVQGDAAQLDAAARLPQVAGRAPFSALDKLAPSLLRALARGQAAGPLRVVGWPGGQAALAQGLPAVLGVDSTAPLSAATLVRLAALPSVRWIEPAGQPRLLNDVARSIMQVDQAWQQRALFGRGQIVAIADSGLDTGDLAELSPDFAGRVVAGHALAQNGDLDDTHGHGTHVAGSVAGSGVQSGADPASRRYAGSFAGVAPEARLVIQAFEVTANGAIIGLDPEYSRLFAQAYANGARLHTNSWGDFTGPSSDPEAQFGGYPYGSQQLDRFVWNNPDMAIFFAAGNSGRDGVPGPLGLCQQGDGVVDPDSLLAPGTAKNAITVGASENERSSGGLSQAPWLLMGNFCFLAEPIASDTLSDNRNGMAAFSSRGPTDDGRIKPDLVAPGTNILSSRSGASGAGTLWGAHAENKHYVYSGGTSMATPLAAGIGVLARQWLVSQGNANPSAAAVKATLLAGAVDIAPGQYGEAHQEVPFEQPNSVAGWGRADLGFVSAPAPFQLWVDDHAAGLETGQTVSYAHTTGRPLTVVDSSQPLRVLLAWSDPPASLSAAAQLVNDLDLRVVGPDGQVYRGNRAAAGDRVNNVEGVVIENPPVGRYSVQVGGYNVPIDTQPYALAVAGPLGEGAPAPQVTLTKQVVPAAEVAPGGLLTYTLALSAGDQALGGTVLTDSLPLHTEFVSASAGGNVNADVVSWAIPPLAAGSTVTRTLVVSVRDDIDDATRIVNADYRLRQGGELLASGQPVAVLVRRPALIDPRAQLWLPLVQE